MERAKGLWCRSKNTVHPQGGLEHIRPISIISHLAEMAGFPYPASLGHWMWAALGWACSWVRRPLGRINSRLRAGAAISFLKGDVGSVFPLPTPGRKLVTFIQISYYSFIYTSRQGIYVNGKIINLCFLPEFYLTPSLFWGSDLSSLPISGEFNSILLWVFPWKPKKLVCWE